MRTCPAPGSETSRSTTRSTPGAETSTALYVPCICVFLSSVPLECRLAEDKLIQVDGDDQWFGRGMTVRLAREDPPLRRKEDAGELLVTGDIVRSRCSTADLDVVVVPLQQSLLIEVQCLLCTVG